MRLSGARFEKNLIREIAPGIRPTMLGCGESCVELLTAISTTKFKINSLKIEISASEAQEAVSPRSCACACNRRFQSLFAHRRYLYAVLLECFADAAYVGERLGSVAVDADGVGVHGYLDTIV